MFVRSEVSFCNASLIVNIPVHSMDSLYKYGLVQDNYGALSFYLWRIIVQRYY